MSVWGVYALQRIEKRNSFDIVIDFLIWIIKVMANGGLIALTGTHMLAKAAKV
jgi:hypothetical protein